MPGFVPAAEVLLFQQKDPKPLTPSSATSDWSDVGNGRGEPTRMAQTRPAKKLEPSAPRAEQQASVREGTEKKGENFGAYF